MDDLRTFYLMKMKLTIKLQQSKFILNILLKKETSRAISTHLIAGPHWVSLSVDKLSQPNCSHHLLSC